MVPRLITVPRINQISLEEFSTHTEDVSLLVCTAEVYKNVYSLISYLTYSWFTLISGNMEELQIIQSILLNWGKLREYIRRTQLLLRITKLQCKQGLPKLSFKINLLCLRYNAP